MKVFKFFLYIFFVFILNLKLFSLNLAENELKKSKTIKFINYKGPYQKKDSLKMVKFIGQELSKGLKKDKYYNFYNKYSIIRCVSDEKTNKFAADILSIDSKSLIKNIVYLRYIIASYLESTYEYSKKDANLFAKFITYYNATYRKNINYIKSNYQKIVLDNVNENNIGLGIQYKEWIGKSKIIIPLSFNKNSSANKINNKKNIKNNKINIAKVDPFVISNKKVRENIRKDENKLEERKEFIKIKEKNLQNQKKQLEKDKKNFKKIEKNITENNTFKTKEFLKKIEKNLQNQKKNILQNEKNLQNDKSELIKDEITLGLKKNTPLALKKVKKNLIERAKNLDQRENQLRDENLDSKIFDKSLYYLKSKKFIKNGHYNNEMLILQANTAEVLVRSKLANICGKKYDISSKGIIVITNIGNHDGKHYLTLLNRQTLETIKTGSTHIFGRSFVTIKENFIYAIHLQNNNYYLAKFNLNLELTAKSDKTVAKDTFISIFQNLIYINDINNNIIVLKKDTLNQIKLITP